MSDKLWIILVFSISCFELWLCYKFLLAIVMKGEELQSKDKWIIQGNIILGAIISTINRKIIFFSHTLFIVILVMTVICACFIYKKKKIYIFMVTTIYDAMVGLLDFFFAFLCIEYIADEFGQSVFVYSKSWWSVAIYLLTRMIMLGIYCVLPKNKYKLEEMKGELSLAGGMLLIVLRYYQLNMVKMVRGNAPWDGIRMGKSLIIALTVIIVGVLLIIKNKMIQRENEYLIMRDELLMQTYCRIEEEIEQNRILMHDIKHDFILLNEYAKKEDLINIRKYLNQMVASFNFRRPGIWTQNKIWDSVILQKKYEAERKEIKVNIHTMMISKFPFDEREGCSIFGNLLDNAIEACEKMPKEERKININIHKHRMLIFIEISNTTNTVLKCKNGYLGTTKDNKIWHGYGLKSVKRIVDKYDGIMEYHIKDNVFSIRLSFFDIKKGEEEENG